MIEKHIEDAVVEYAESKGWLVRKVVYAGRRGAPDRWFFKNGVLLMIEFKRPGRPLDGHQDKERQRMAAVGHRVHVIDDIAKGKALFD